MARSYVIRRRIYHDIQEPPFLEPEALEASKNRIKLNLFYIDLAILILSGAAGYFLAGRTLNPIKEMVDEQNRFITDSSHELRTPLTSLKTTIEVSLRDKNLTLKDSKRLLESNLEEVNNLEELSNDLLRLSRASKPRTALDFEEIYLEEIVKGTVKKVSPLAKSKNIKLEENVINDPFFGSKSDITELLVILLDNAIKYSPQGSKVTLRAKRSDGQVKIELEDQGIGIAEAELPHIFDRFYRVDTSRTKSKIDGFGLGLSIAKKIVEEHHGKIEVKSQLGKGSTFIIWLPTEKSQAKEGSKRFLSLLR